MQSTISTKINELSYEELERISLQETLNVEEAICDAASPIFLRESADIPEDTNSIKELLKGTSEYDKYQIFNQNYITGVSADEAHEMYDPDSNVDGKERIDVDMGDEDDSEAGGLNESNLNYDFVSRSVSDYVNGDLSVMYNDMPSDFDAILTGGNTLRRKTNDVHSLGIGVPQNVEDILAGRVIAADIIDQVNGKEPQAAVAGKEGDAVRHPVGTHQNQTLKECSATGIAAMLLAESSEEEEEELDDADTAILNDDDDEEDDDVDFDMEDLLKSDD